MKNITSMQCDKKTVAIKILPQLKRSLALTALFLIELAVGLLGGAAAAAVLIPIAQAERGYTAFGGEWLLIFAFAAATYHIFHNRLFKDLNK